MPNRLAHAVMRHPECKVTLFRQDFKVQKPFLTSTPSSLSIFTPAISKKITNFAFELSGGSCQFLVVSCELLAHLSVAFKSEYFSNSKPTTQN